MPSSKLDFAKKQHRERSQPTHRRKLGLLEKHKDYVKRARDFHSKQDRLQKLREKAAGRNQDEFYFGMIKSKTKKGVHIQENGNAPLPVDLVKLLKTQDVKYIQDMRKKEQKEIRKLQAELSAMTDLRPGVASLVPGDVDGERATLDSLLADPSSSSHPVASTSASASSSAANKKRKHIVFTDDLNDLSSANPLQSVKDREAAAAAASSSTEEAQSSKKRKRNKGKAKAIPVDGEQQLSRAERAELSLEHKTEIVAELKGRMIREKALARAQRDAEVQKLLMSKGTKREIVGNRNQPTAEEMRGIEDDEADVPAKGGKKTKRLPEPAVGVRTGARVWKWKSERKK